MAYKFTNGIDLIKTSLINAVLHPVTVDVSSPVDGQIWYRSDTDRFRVQANGVTQDLAFMTDVTGGAITGTLWDAQSYIKAITDDTPVVQVVGDSEFVGRPAGGNIGVITKAQALAILNVADGAQVNDTAAQILTKLLTVDGTGSGLDADTLDGIDSTGFVTTSAFNAAVQGITWKNAVRAATTANITLSGTQTIDGVAVIVGDRVLAKNQSTASANGIYVCAAGAWSRATDADTAAEVTGLAVRVNEGTTNQDTAWHQTADSVTLGTTNLVFSQWGATYTAGTGITLTGNQFSIGTGAITDALLASTFTKKFSQTIGNGAATAIAVTHSLGTRDITWSVQDAATFEFIMCDVVATSTSVATFTFATAPATNAYRVTIIG